MNKFFAVKFSRNEIKKLIFLLLLVVIISLSGCGGSSSNVKKVQKHENPIKETEEMSEQEKAIRGELSIESSKTTISPRDDADEIRFTENPAGLSNPLTGRYEDEANAMREKILNCENTENVYNITGTKYYVSPDGNDENDGKSPQSPFRTIDGLGSVDFEKGDAILFERGAIFRLIQPLSTTSGVIYGSYGTGDKPKLYASPKNYANVEWKPSERRNIWKANYVYDTACSVVFDNGKEIGYLKTSVRNLTENTHFFQDESGAVIYLYCDKGNPAKVYKSIEICPKMNIVNIPQYVSDVTIDNLCLRYSGTFGVSAIYNNNNITVSNCEIGFIGGTNNGQVRYGNAVQAWTNASNFKVTGNYIYQTFDTAITWQGQDVDGGKNVKYKDCLFADNLLEYNNGDFEFWHNNAVVDNFVIKNNICRFTSLGWGTRANDGGYRGIEGFIYAKTHNMVHENQISILDNIVDCPGRQFINWSISPYNTSNYNVSGTKVFVKQSYRTTTEILRGYQKDENDAEMLFSTSLEELKSAISRFDENAVVEWSAD